MYLYNKTLLLLMKQTFRMNCKKEIIDSEIFTNSTTDIFFSDASFAFPSLNSVFTHCISYLKINPYSLFLFQFSAVSLVPFIIPSVVTFALIPRSVQFRAPTNQEKSSNFIKRLKE